MKDFIEKEKAKLQALFTPFNEQVSWMVVHEGRDAPLELGLIDSYTVTRLAPVFDAKGEMKELAFWLLFKEAGYHHGFQYSHTIKVLRHEQDDTYLIDLTDDRARRHHVELLFPTLDPELIRQWKEWQAYKAEHREDFKKIDEQILEEHLQIAESWPA